MFLTVPSLFSTVNFAFFDPKIMFSHPFFIILPLYIICSLFLVFLVVILYIKYIMFSFYWSVLSKNNAFYKMNLKGWGNKGRRYTIRPYKRSDLSIAEV